MYLCVIWAVNVKVFYLLLYAIPLITLSLSLFYLFIPVSAKKKRLFNLFISNITIDYMFLWKITNVTSDNVDSLIWDNKVTRGLWKCCVMLCNVVVIRIFNEKKKKVKSWIVNILTRFTSLKTRLYREVES